MTHSVVEILNPFLFVLSVITQQIPNPRYLSICLIFPIPGLRVFQLRIFTAINDQQIINNLNQVFNPAETFCFSGCFISHNLSTVIKPPISYIIFILYKQFLYYTKRTNQNKTEKIDGKYFSVQEPFFFFSFLLFSFCYKVRRMKINYVTYQKLHSLRQKGFEPDFLSSKIHFLTTERF